MARLFSAATSSTSKRCGVNLRSCLLLAVGMLAVTLGGTPAAAQQKARITMLSDVTFGTLADLTVDTSSTQSICVFSSSATNGYNVSAVGSGSGGAFTLQSSAGAIPFDVQWNSAPNQSSGTQLSPNAALSGLTSTAKQQACNSGPSTSASLIVILRAAAVSIASAGSYTGTLTLTIAPE